MTEDARISEAVWFTCPKCGTQYTDKHVVCPKCEDDRQWGPSPLVRLLEAEASVIDD